MNSQEVLNMSSKTIDIPLRVTMSTTEGSSFEFSSMIDEGKILITPESTEMQFDVVLTQDSMEFETPILDQETEISKVGDIIIKSTSLSITADMLAESENMSIFASINDLGQVVITPADENNSFVSAVINDSLNLVTEDTQSVDYFGYNLTNSDNTWSIKDYTGAVVDEGVASLAEAKIAALTHEIHVLESLLSESLEQPSEEGSLTDDSEVDQQVEAEVVILDESATSNFDKNSVITKFMQGELALFSDDGAPQENMIELEDLASGSYHYYYDPESGAVVSYYIEQE